MNKFLFTIACITLFQQALVAKEYSKFSISFINDAIFGEDKDYTSGLEFGYKHVNNNVTYYFGQDIYTPKNKKTTTPLIGEHPYGAWLYVGASKNYKFDRTNNSFKLKVGTIGSNAKGKAVSNELHKIIGASKENGWDTQVDKSLAYNLNIKSIYDQFAIKPFITTNLGNVFTDIGLGIMVEKKINIFLELYASGERKYIDENIFLEGETKSGSSAYSVKKIDYKNIYTIGARTTYFDNYTINAELIFNSKEYETQAKANNLGMIKIVRKF